MVKRTLFFAIIAFALALGVAQIAVPGEDSDADAVMAGAADSTSDPGQAQSVRPTDSQPAPIGLAELRRDADSHFRAAATVNGRPLTMLVDSGASLVVLTEADARTVGIYLSAKDFTATAHTAGGEVKMAPVVIDRLSVNGIERRNVAGAVVPAGLLNQSLLGQSFLGQLSEVTIRDDVMRLR